MPAKPLDKSWTNVSVSTPCLAHARAINETHIVGIVSINSSAKGLISLWLFLRAKPSNTCLQQNRFC